MDFYFIAIQNCFNVWDADVQPTTQDLKASLIFLFLILPTCSCFSLNFLLTSLFFSLYVSLSFLFTLFKCTLYSLLITNSHLISLPGTPFSLPSNYWSYFFSIFWLSCNCYCLILLFPSHQNIHSHLHVIVCSHNHNFIIISKFIYLKFLNFRYQYFILHFYLTHLYFQYWMLFFLRLDVSYHKNFYICILDVFPPNLILEYNLASSAAGWI